MTGLYIFLGIVIFILAVLMIPVHVAADYKNEFSLKIKFLFFFKYVVFPESEKKKEKKEKQKQKEEPKTEKAPAEKKEKRKMTVEEIIDTVIDYVNKFGPGARMILRNIRFHRLELYWKVTAEDAAACGLKYGKICAWLSGVFGFFRNFVKIENPKIKVFPDFISEKDEIYGGADIEFNPLIVLIGALRIAFVFLKDLIKNNKTKSAKPQKKIKTKESASA